jgi:hypothetical protein
MHAQTNSVACPHSYSVGARVFYQELKVVRARADYTHPTNDQVQNVIFLTCLFTAFIVQDGHRGKCINHYFGYIPGVMLIVLLGNVVLFKEVL